MMRVLILSPTLCWPLDIGEKIRIYHVLRELARAGHEVTLLTLAHVPYGPVDLEALRPFCGELKVVPVAKRPRLQAALKALFSLKTYRVAKFESPEFTQEIVQALKKEHDVLWIHFMETLAYVPLKALRKKKPLLVLDQHNADERFWETYAREGPPWVRLFARQNIWKLQRFQRAVLPSVDVILSVSAEDAEWTRSRLPNPSTEIWVVPNGVDTENLRPPEPEDTKRENRILFCGAMDVLMNIDAVERFAGRVFPRVQREIPDAEFWIVGRDPHPRVKALGALPGVRVTGRVEDVRPYYAEAKVAVAPFRYGGGTKLKVLEAMALGIPVVATPVGYRGIEAVPREHLFVEEDDEVFAQRVIALLRDESLRREMAAKARRLVEQKYSWHGIFKERIAHLEELVRVRSR